MLVSHEPPKKLPNSEHFPHWRQLCSHLGEAAVMSLFLSTAGMSSKMKCRERPGRKGMEERERRRSRGRGRGRRDVISSSHSCGQVAGNFDTVLKLDILECRLFLFQVQLEVLRILRKSHSCPFGDFGLFWYIHNLIRGHIG